MALLLSPVLTLIATIAAFCFMFWVGTGQHGPKVTASLLLRLVVVFIPAAAACYAALWFAAALLFPAGFSPPLGVIATLLAASAVTYFTCLHTPACPPGLLGSVVLGAFVTGGVAFSAGFFGPMVFLPSSLHAPLFGLFVTGPLGFVLGAIAGAIHWFARHPRTAPPSHVGAA